MASEKDISLGEFLRQERERRGITIEQVASATKVGVRTLHSLEADQYSELPAKPFVRGFVTSYCRFIGLDPKEILGRYEEFIGVKVAERPNRESGHSGYVFEKKDGEQQSRTILMIAMCTFVVLGAVAMLVLKPSIKHHRSSHIDKLRAAHQQNSPDLKGVISASPSPLASPVAEASPRGESQVAQVAPVAKATPVATPTPSPSVETRSKTDVAGTNAADPLDSGLELKGHEIHHKLTLKTLADVWVRYQVDERPIRKFIVRKGKVLVLRAKDKIRFQVSNPNSVTATYNGKGAHTVRDLKNATVKQGNTTLFYPADLASQTEKPFGDAAPLPSTEDPKEESSAPESSPE